MILNSRSPQGWSKPLIAAFGKHASVSLRPGESLEHLQDFVAMHQDYIFGHVGYNLKETTEGVHCAFQDKDGFNASSFFVPEIVVIAELDTVRIGYLTEEALRDFQLKWKSESERSYGHESIQFRQATDRSAYLQKAGAILDRIHRGDIYEINFCVEFFQENAVIHPLSTWQNLMQITEAPFGGLYQSEGNWLMCGSPELYLRKKGNRISSQPIKGTRKRGKNAEEDEHLRNELYHDRKERSENIMIVDLVRNDLSKVARKGSVTVSELFGITSFKTVHQMSSTIECEVDDDLLFTSVIAATFPMGSMTGAPKISAMQIAEQHEAQSRGIYSGSIGYITPAGDFEFNVVIRSITWNESTGYLSVKAGSALTAACDPEKEYEECLLKAEAMMNALKRV